MAESIKNQDLNKSQSGVQPTIGQVGEKVNEFKKKISERLPESIQQNRFLMYAGLGLLLVGAGFGIWSLVSSMRGSDMDEGESLYGRDDFSRRSAY